MDRIRPIRLLVKWVFHSRECINVRSSEHIIMRSLLLLLSILTLSAADRRFDEYDNEGDVAANVQFARENPALTG